MKLPSRYLKVAILFYCGQMIAQPYFPSDSTAASVMNKELSVSDVPALVAIGLHENGREVRYAFGPAVWENPEPVTTHHIFRIASMTKLLTSIAALQLVEQGRLGLDEDLSELMPSMAEIPILTNGQLKEARQPITLRHLLTHTSGFGYSFTDKDLAEFDQENWSYRRLPRRFESGTGFLYGTSLDWVGELVEKISGLTLESYFRTHITGPLGMDRTWFNVPDSLKTDIVSFGGRGNDGQGLLTEFPNRIPDIKVEKYSGGGGLFSSPHDFSLLLKCLLNGGKLNDTRILQRSTIDMMFSDHTGDIDLGKAPFFHKPGFCCDFEGIITPSSKWGLAFMIETEKSSYGRSAGTAIWGGLYNTYFFIDRESGIAASIFTQHLPFNHEATTDLFRKFSKILYLAPKEH